VLARLIYISRITLGQRRLIHMRKRILTALFTVLTLTIVHKQQIVTVFSMV